MRRAYIGLGGNEGDVSLNLQAAIAEIGELPETRVVRVSSLYRTAPVGLVEQPDFLNGVVAVDTSLEPADLLDRLLAIERSLGRTREVPGGPRTVDLDLLLWGDRVVETPSLRVPHPRMHERAFVLIPLAEIAPHAVHPVLSKSIRELRDALESTSDVIPLDRPGGSAVIEEETTCSAES
jgi:2-amino-4-hydroxy-6-hydroxymethyldihydropteridine diphosphokinase